MYYKIMPVTKDNNNIDLLLKLSLLQSSNNIYGTFVWCKVGQVEKSVSDEQHKLSKSCF